jgi:hypothetical protein
MLAQLKIAQQPRSYEDTSPSAQSRHTVFDSGGRSTHNPSNNG